MTEYKQVSSPTAFPKKGKVSKVAVSTSKGTEKTMRLYDKADAGVSPIERAKKTP